MVNRILFTSALFLVMLVFLSGPAFSATLYVKPGTPYDTIQKAIDAAAPGDTILINALPSNQAYNETIVVDKNDITLKGSFRSTPRRKCKDMNTSSRRSMGVHDLREFVSQADNWDDCCSPVILDACDGESCMKTAITITAPNVTVEKLTIRHASNAIRLEQDADNAVIKNSCFFDSTDDAIYGRDANMVTVNDCLFFGGERNSIYLYECDNATVTKNRFRSIENGIRIWGDNALVDTNISLNCDIHAIYLFLSDNGIVRNNWIEAADDAVHICGGANVLVSNNRSISADNGIYMVGTSSGNYPCPPDSILTNPVVVDNWIEGGEQGIVITTNQGTNPNPTVRNNVVKYVETDSLGVWSRDCTSGLIEDNKVSFALTDGDCMYIRASNLTIRNNVLEYCSQMGLRSEGNNNYIIGNTVRFCGSGYRIYEPGIKIDGDNNLIERNTVSKNAADGIASWNGSDNNIYRENTLFQNGMSGICIGGNPGTVSDGNSIEGNIIKLNHGEGINIGEYASNTNIINNTVTGNKTDICNEGTGSTFSGDIYYTGGPTFDCVVR